MNQSYNSRYQTNLGLGSRGVGRELGKSRTGFGGANLSPQERVSNIISQMETPEIQEVLAFSWIQAIHALATLAREMGGALSAAEAAHLLSPFWRLGKTYGLQGQQLFDFAVRHVTAELPMYEPRRAQALGEEYPIPTSPPAFGEPYESPYFQENPLYRERRRSPRTPRGRYGERAPGVPPQLRLRPGEPLPFNLY